MLAWLALVGIESRCSVATFSKQPRHRIAVRGREGADRRVFQIVDRADAMLRRLHREKVRCAGCRIGPEIGPHLHRGGQAHIEVGGDAVDGPSELGGAGAIDGGEEFRRIDFLLNMSVGDPRNGGDLLAQRAGNREIVGAVVADGADVDLCRDAEVQDLGDHVGGLKVEDRLGDASGSTWRKRWICSPVGRWPSFRVTRMTPSLTPMAVPSAKARLKLRAGKPMLSSMSPARYPG